jgi:hypothetical protein
MGGVAEGAWAVYDETISVRKIKDTIDRSKSEYPLAALLEAIGDAEELHPPKKILFEGLAKGKSKARRKRRRS